MLERVQDRSLFGVLSLDSEECLHGAAKALAQWAIVDDYDNILDLDCCDGKAECNTNAHQGTELIRIMNAIYKSAETGKEILF